MSRWTLLILGAVLTMVLASPVGADEKFTVTERVGEAVPDVSFDFKEAKFTEVVDYIAKQSGRNILIDGNIEDVVTLRLVGVKWRRALEMVCEQIGAVIEEETDSVLRVSKPVTINFELEDAPLSKVIGTIAKIAEASVIIGPNVKGVVTAQFYDVPWTQALGDVVRTNGYVLLKEGKAMRIMDPAGLEEQLVTRVFALRYIQPPDNYVPKIDSKFITQTKGAEGVTGVAGAGQVLGGVQGMPNTAGGLGAPAAALSAGGGGGGGGQEAEFPLLVAITRIASQKGHVDYIPATNSFIITDTEPNVKAIAQLIDSMDKEPLQVFIDVKFISTDLTNKDNRGMNWPKGLTATSSYGKMASRLPFSMTGDDWNNAIAPLKGPVATTDIYTGITSAGLTGPYQFGLLDFTAMSQTLELFAQDNRSEIKQSPQILVLDNQQATVFVGQTIRWAETDSASNQAGGVQVGIKEAANSPIDTGFQLYVRPHIIPGDNKVILSVIPKAEQLAGTGTTIAGFDDFTNGTASIQLPRVQSSTLVTKLIMTSGQTAVLGGMITEEESTNENKVPILGDIPILGWAFKWKSKTKTKSDLLVFLTVHIVKNDSEVRKIYTVYGEKYGGEEYHKMQTGQDLRWNKPKEKGYGSDEKTAGGDM